MIINLKAPINDLGYGITGLNILKQLMNHNHTVSFFPIGQSKVDNQEDFDYVRSAESNQANFDFKAPCLKIWHQHDLAERIGNGKYFGWPIFELDKFTDREIKNLNSCDHIIVCSEWAKTIVERNIDRPCSVVPLGIDHSIFYPRSNRKQSSKCIFFNCGKWEIRKGHGDL